jgi:hypothetical protein
MTITPSGSIVSRLFSAFRVNRQSVPCPPQQSGPTHDWGASVLQSIRCELPLMESIVRVM